MSPLLPTITKRPILPQALTELQQRFGARCSTAASVLAQHGRDESSYTHVPPPDAVVMVRDRHEVIEVLAIARRYRIPVIPYGVGSSIEGQILATHGGISLDLSAMNAIRAVYPEDFCVVVEPGVTREQLNRFVRDHGLFFPVDPGADATLGGMAATRASGTNAVRYGTMRDNVLALEVVLANGEAIRTGTRARKSSAGYDLTHLFIGSEGTLGIITELTLRLHPLPEAIAAAICSFPDVGAAVRTTIAIIQAGIPIARCELLDANTVRAVNRYCHLQLPEGAMLLMEFHGSPNAVREQTEAVQSLASEHGGSDFAWATAPEERTKLWTARHRAYFAGLQLRPGARCVTTDACVPISKLAENVVAAVEDAERVGLPYFLVGHVGDGNFHMGYLIDPDNASERELAESLNEALVRRALASGGTCTGEHGVGLHKRHFLPLELGEAAVATMRALKRALDPEDILNPGKIFPELP